MKTSITDFQRNFRRAREAADRGDRVVVVGESGEYVFERRTAPQANPFAGLEKVFGAVKLPPGKGSLRDKVRRRITASHSHRRRRSD